MKTSIFHSVFVIFLLTICLDSIWANLPTIDEATDKSQNDSVDGGDLIADDTVTELAGESVPPSSSGGESAPPPVGDNVLPAKPENPTVLQRVSNYDTSVMGALRKPKDIVESIIPKEAEGRPSFAPASHDGAQSGTYGGTAHPSAWSRNQTLMGPTGNLVPALNGRKRQIGRF